MLVVLQFLPTHLLPRIFGDHQLHVGGASISAYSRADQGRFLETTDFMSVELQRCLRLFLLTSLSTE